MKKWVYIIVAVIAAGIALYIPPKGIVRTMRDKLLYALPFTLPGLPVCPDCNIVLINLDTLVPGNMGCYGYARDTTPNICAYAKKNLLFTQYFDQTSFTLDSHMSIFTGLYPTTHHVLDALKDTLNPEIPLLTSVLQKSGYRTFWAGITNDINLPLNKGFERGFDEIHNLDGRSSQWRSDYKKLLPALDGEKPAFIFFHSYKPHSPYLPGNGHWRFSTKKFPWIPVSDTDYYANTLDFYEYVLDQFHSRLTKSTSKESYERNSRIIEVLSSALREGSVKRASETFWTFPMYEQYDLNVGWYWQKIDPEKPEIISYMKDLYDEQIYQADTDIKDMLDFFNKPNIKRKTIVILLSDNGEDFGEHGHFDHGWNIYNTGTHAPFIMSVPRARQGVYHELIQAVDIFPTLLDLVGISRKHIPLEGNSLVSIIMGLGEQQVGERYLVSQHRGTDVTAIRSTRWKMYINNTAERWFLELYDLMTDPNEQHNVLGEHMGIARHLDTTLMHILDMSPKYASVSGVFPDWLDDEKRRTLIEEGYF